MDSHDLSHEGYGPEYYSGMVCIEEGCDEPAGTAWCYHWCAKHDIERRERISGQFEKILDSFNDNQGTD